MLLRKYYEIHRKTTAMESIFSKVSGLVLQFHSKQGSIVGVFPLIFRNLTNQNICHRVNLLKIETEKIIM